MTKIYFGTYKLKDLIIQLSFYISFCINSFLLQVHQSESAVLRRANVRDWSDLQLELQLSFIHFDEGRLVLQCVAQISSIYREVAELELESVRHPVPARGKFYFYHLASFAEYTDIKINYLWIQTHSRSTSF